MPPFLLTCVFRPETKREFRAQKLSFVEKRMFDAFRSDSESEGGSPIKKNKPKAKPVTKAQPKKDIQKSQKQPKPVAHKPVGKPAFKKNEVMEPSNVENKIRRDKRPPHVKPGDTDRHGKRIFDRKSGTGRDRGVKKGGGGSRNWGQPMDKTNTYNTNVSISMDNDQDPPRGGNNQEGDEEEKKVVEEEEEEPKEPEKETFTIEEYMKKKAEKRGGSGFEELKGAEVEKVKEGRAYTKKDKSTQESEDAFFIGASGERKGKKKAVTKASKGKKMVPELGFTVKNQDRDSRSFRGRGRGRGDSRGGRGGFRGARGGGYRSRPSRVDVDTNDQQNFPQLGA